MNYEHFARKLRLPTTSCDFLGLPMQPSQPSSYPWPILPILHQESLACLCWLSVESAFRRVSPQDLKPGCCPRARSSLGIPKDY